MKKKLFVAVLALLGFAWLSAQSCCDLARPDAHAPITIMGDHLHRRGEIMYGYHFHFMNMNHPHDQSSGHVHTGGGSMDMRMHMAEVMYGLSDRWTAMGMFSYLSNIMTHVQNEQATARSIGDLQLGAMFHVWKNRWLAAHGQLVVSLPTGSIDQRQQTNRGNLRLPYMMQLGSGTVDLQPGLTILWQKPRWSGGFQSIETVRLGKNKNGYRFGNHFGLNGWAARRIGKQISLSARSAAHFQTRIEGQDTEIPNTFLIPSGWHVDFSIGLNFRFGGSFLKGHRLGIEAARPIFYTSDLNRQRTNWEVSGGWQKSKLLR